MVDETFQNEPLEALAEKIARYANEAEERTIEAAKLLRVLRSRVEKVVGRGIAVVPEAAAFVMKLRANLLWSRRNRRP